MVETYTDQFILGLVEFFVWAKWLFLLAVCLTIGDLKFGIAASRYRKQQIKRSRAIRRTIDKICGYCLWVIMAYAFGEAFGKPFGVDLLPLVILLVIYGVELESMFVNYFATKGKTVKINFFGFMSRKTDIIEIKEEEKESNEKN